MRRALDALYDGAAALAALFMVLLLAAVLTSVLGRQFGFHAAHRCLRRLHDGGGGFLRWHTP